MRTSALESKTVRPGLMRYSFYASERRPVSQAAVAKAKPQPRRHGWLIALALIVLLGAGVYALKPSSAKTVSDSHSSKTPVATSQIHKSTPPAAAPAVATATPVNNCAGNSLANFIKVSISQRHLWACQGEKSVYDSPIVTGIDYLAADRTPVGTYHIYGKYTDLTLRGSDSTGSWSDPVSYWMPFLSNQYGQYGFHDATWRSDSDFGNIDPNSANASHGCVELPLATAKWLFDWAPVGTTLTIQS